MTGKFSNVTAEEMRRIAAALAANLPPPEEIEPRPVTAALCIHAHDTGVPAFVGLPCRGNRIECRKTGVVTYAAACRAGTCRYYSRGPSVHDSCPFTHIAPQAN